MHPVAKRCLIWAAVLVVAGVLMLQFGANLVTGFQHVVGANGEVALYAFHFVTGVIRSFGMPLAAALVAAAIVIQTLAPRPEPQLTED